MNIVCESMSESRVTVAPMKVSCSRKKQELIVSNGFSEGIVAGVFRKRVLSISDWWHIFSMAKVLKVDNREICMLFGVKAKYLYNKKRSVVKKYTTLKDIENLTIKRPFNRYFIQMSIIYGILKVASSSDFFWSKLDKLMKDISNQIGVDYDWLRWWHCLYNVNPSRCSNYPVILDTYNSEKQSSIHSELKTFNHQLFGITELTWLGLGQTDRGSAFRGNWISISRVYIEVDVDQSNYLKHIKFSNYRVVPLYEVPIFNILKRLKNQTTSEWDDLKRSNEKIYFVLYDKWEKLQTEYCLDLVDLNELDEFIDRLENGYYLYQQNLLDMLSLFRIQLFYLRTKLSLGKIDGYHNIVKHLGSDICSFMRQAKWKAGVGRSVRLSIVLDLEHQLLLFKTIAKHPNLKIDESFEKFLSLLHKSQIDCSKYSLLLKRILVPINQTLKVDQEILKLGDRQMLSYVNSDSISIEHFKNRRL